MILTDCGHNTVEDITYGRPIPEELCGSEYGQVTGWCTDCGKWVYLMPPEDKDDKAYWEVME